MSTLQVANLVFESTANNRIQYIGSNTLTFHTASTERMRIDDNGNLNITGNVGIGSVVGSNRLLISTPLTGTTIRSNPALRIQSEATGRDICIQFSDNITNSAEVGMLAGNVYFTSNGIERMRIDASGNVGIGTTSPSAKLEVNGNIKDSKGDVRDLPINNQTTAYVTVAADSGKTITTTANVTVNGAIFTTGQAVSIYNNSASSITILPGTGVTMYLGGSATTGNRTLAQRGVATALMVASNTFVISGAGLS